ncbi:MAG: hypothetical protein NC930_05115, partial [Candidatus Omnitrophica bacterium]|nr:hypothetical protein [Candidatus Omnitrophota bacterium]
MSPARKQTYFAIVNALCDCAAIALSFGAAYAVRFLIGVIPVGGRPGFLEYAKALAVILPVYLWFFREYGLYQTARHIRRIEEIFLVVKSVTFATLILMAISFFYRGLSYSRIFLAFLWIFC